MAFIAEGREIGRVEGIEIGEEKRALKIASKMLAKGVPTETISEFTELDEETILSLKK
jgi:predicted transposase YdaD